MELQEKVKRLIAANATLRETIKAKDKEIEEANRFISLMCGKCAYKQDDKAMIEKMKCCGNCDNLWQEECSLSPESKNQCLKNKNYLLWELKK